MVQVSFAIKINPRVPQLVRRANEDALRRASDRFLKDIAKDALETMREEAPERTGALRAGIIIKEKSKSGGSLDRRANISVESTAPHSRYVVAGAPPSIGDGSPGTGQFFGPGGISRNHLGTGGSRNFPATRGFTGGKAFRSGDGFWPGFRANNFVDRAALKVFAKANKSIRFIGINAYTESFNKLGVNFGG